MDSHSIIGTKNKKGQTYTDPYHLFFEAPRIPSFFTGSEVIKEAIRRASVDLMVAYPITPQSEAAALIGELYAEGYVDRKSTRLNSSHTVISYAVFCLKKKKKEIITKCHRV